MPALEQARGAVINVLSVVSLSPVAALGGYSASKAAAYSLSQALHVDLAKKGIAVYSALPAGIDTEMVAKLDIPKTSARDVAVGILDGAERGERDIYPDPGSRSLSEVWRGDPRATLGALNGS